MASLAEFQYYAFGIFFEGSYGSGFSPEVGAVGLLRTGLVMLLPAFTILLMMSRRQEWYLPVLCATLFGVLFTLVANSVSRPCVRPLLTCSICSLACCRWPACWIAGEQHSDALGLLCISLVVLTASWLLASSSAGLERQGVVLGAGARGARQQPAVEPAGADPGAALARAGTCAAPPWLASLAMLALLVSNAWEGNLKGRPFNPPAQVRVDRIKAETGPTDKIWVDGIQPQYYLWTDRQPASAYLFFCQRQPAL